MSRFVAICPSCIGLGKIMYAGELRVCERCKSEGRVPGIGRFSATGKLLEIVPDPEAEDVIP